jgi:flagellar basal body rod protein FlgC
VTNVLSIAASGLSAASFEMATAASKIVNLRSNGASGNASQPAAQGSRGVYYRALTSMPAIDPLHYVVSEITASMAYKANLKTFAAAETMMKSALDLLA